MKKIYVIRDNKAEAFTDSVSIHAHDAVAIREFGDLIGDQRTILSKHTQDFDLYCLGNYDTDNGIYAEDAGQIKQDTIKDDARLYIKPALLITGKQWLDAQPKTQQPIKLEA